MEQKWGVWSKVQHKQGYLTEITKMIHRRQQLYRIVTFAFPDNDCIKWSLVGVDLVYSFFIIASASQAQEKAQPVTSWLSRQQEGKKSITLLQYKDYSEFQMFWQENQSFFKRQIKK